MKTILTAAFIVFSTLRLVGQYYGPAKYDYTWEEKYPNPIELHYEFAEEPLVVLDDVQRVSLRGNKDDLTFVYFERKQRIRIETPEAVEQVKTLVLPEAFDPYTHARELPFERQSEVSGEFLNAQIVFFAARKIRPDGGTEALLYTQVMRTKMLNLDKEYHPVFTYNISFIGLEPGDEIEFHYKLEIPFNSNWYWFNSARHFFNNKVPIQRQEVTFEWPQSVACYFGGELPSEEYTENKRMKKVWRKRLLHGNVFEPGIRPDKYLPHIVYSFHVTSLRYNTLHHLSRQLIVNNYRTYVLQRREWVAIRLLRSAERNFILDGQTRKLLRFLKTETAHINSDSLVDRLNHVHSVITNDFDYQWDNLYFLLIDQGLEKAGNQIEDRRLREISRYTMYARLISYLGLNYETAYMLDSRIGQMSKSYWSPMVFNDFAFAVADGGYLNLYFPKKDRFGYEVNEFPFYLAATPALRVNIGDLYFKEDYRPSYIELPSVDPSFNQRSAKITADINSESMVAQGNLQLNLSGQFSTLTRSVYEFGRADSSINPAYARTVFEDLDVVFKKVSSKPADVNNAFASEFVYDFIINDIAQPVANDRLELAFEGWFNFIVWENLDSKKRTLPFYSDFTGGDHFSVELNFDEAVKILNLPVLEQDVQNPYGSFRVSVDQISNNRCTIDAKFVIYADKMEAADVHHVTALYKAIADFSSAKLLLQKQEN
jgi:hypothetical protein